MTASFRALRARPPVSAPVRPANRPPDLRPMLDGEDRRRAVEAAGVGSGPAVTRIDNTTIEGEFELPEVTVSITVRGDDAISAIAPLVAAVQALGTVEVSVDTTARGLRGWRRPSALDNLPVECADFGGATGGDFRGATGGDFRGPAGGDFRGAAGGGDGTPPLTILVDEYAAVLDGAPLTLTRREFDLLCFLAEHPRRVFSRSQLLQTVWGYDFSGGGRTVDVHVRRLRQKLGTRGPSISTVRGVGYRLDEAERVLVLSGG